MTPIYALIAVAAVGVEAGWEPLADGGHQYTIQIEPSIVGLLEHGNDLVSEVPPQVNVRRFRIKIGTGAVARIDGPTTSPKRPDDAPPGESIDRAIVAPSETTHGADASPPGKSSDSPAVPAKFSDQAAGAQPLGVQPSGFDEPATAHNTEKPRLDSEPSGESQPWLPFLIAGALLCCSLAANFYLGWIAWDTRARYRTAVSKLRTAAPA